MVADKFFLLPSDWPFTVHTHFLNPDLLTFAAKHYSELCLIPEPQTIWQHVSKRVSFLWNVVPSPYKLTGSDSKISANQFANELRITRCYWTVLSALRVRLSFNKTTQTNISKYRIAPVTDWWVERINRKALKKSGTNYFDCKLFNLEACKNFMRWLSKYIYEVRIIYLNKNFIVKITWLIRKWLAITGLEVKKTDSLGGVIGD